MNSNYFIISQNSNDFGRIGKLMDRKEGDLLVLLMQFGKIVEVHASRTCPYTPSRFGIEVIRYEAAKLHAEITLLNLYVNGTFGFKRQMEYDHKGTYDRLDRLLKFKQEWELLEEQLMQYSWLLEAEEVEREKRGIEQQKRLEEFHNSAFPKATSFFTHQLNLF